MPFAPGYTKTKTFAALGSLLAADLNSIQDDLGNQIVMVAPEDVVSALPGSPVDGQIIRYQNAAMALLGVVWTLRYNSASASIYKWEFIGGGDLYNAVATAEATASVTFVALATSGPNVTVPLAGDYEVGIEAELTNSVANTGAVMSYQIGATAADENDRIISYPAGASLANTVARRRVKTFAVAATVLSARYRQTGAGSGSFNSRTMYVRPIRVG